MLSIRAAISRDCSAEFREFLDAIENQVPAGLEVHLIMDNYSTHKTALVRKWLAKRPRFHVHFTPTYGSWLNLVERWFAELTNERIRRGVFRSVKELETAIREYMDVHNETPRPFVGTRTADQILDGIARYAQRTLASHPNRLISRTTGTEDQGIVKSLDEFVARGGGLPDPAVSAAAGNTAALGTSPSPALRLRSNFPTRVPANVAVAFPTE